ncbi:acetolactate synthase [Lactarius indigo]|nr:acetolactate synthase [Lactarius indigo]
MPRILSDGTPPKPPPPIDDSTSALDYKTSHKVRLPPLPKMDLPWLRSAEKAVTNILYNTLLPNLQPYKKYVLNCLVQNEPGVLSRVSGILAGRGFNIDSSGQDGVIKQAHRRLEDLVPAWAVLDYTETRTTSRELLLVKVSILGPEYREDQLEGGPLHEPRTAPTPNSPSPSARWPSRATLRSPCARARGGRGGREAAYAERGALIDANDHSVIVEIAGKMARVEAALALVKPIGIIESARTGLITMPRTPIAGLAEDDTSGDVGSTVDARLLPPGKTAPKILRPKSKNIEA